MKILLTVIFVAILSTLPTATANSSILLTQPEPQLFERIDFQKELEMELSILKKIKLTDEQRRKLIKLDLELEQKRPPV